MKAEVKKKTGKWVVQFIKSAEKHRDKLPDKIRALIDLLAGEMELMGPIRKNWKNFSSLFEDDYHCHLKKGRPTYVACWRIISKTNQIIEVYYVGTHEGAPY